MTQETTQQERFKYMREEIINLSQAKLAQKLGLSNQQRIADIETGRKQKIDSEILQKLSAEYLINLEWLLFGQGVPTKLDTMEYYEYKLSGENIISIPFYSAKASAGSGEALPDYPEKDVMWFDSRWLKNIVGVSNTDNLAIIQAKGDSMDGGVNPIKDGDLLMVDESYKEPINNQVFVVNLGNNEIVVKRINRHWDGQLSLESDNPKYPFIIPSKEATIIGKVVWNGNSMGIA
jgi:phage repressor protein C with HTH and peptisase S24 domain